jgi:predicted NUDIX family NTP pyrophosphohydrolase
LEWPPNSGRQQEFPEIDRAAWFTLNEAKEKIIPGQLGFLAELEQLLTP